MPPRLDFTKPSPSDVGPSLAGALESADQLGATGAAPVVEPATPREAVFRVKNVLDAKTGKRHTLTLTCVADGARNMGPAFHALVGRFGGGVPWAWLPPRGQFLAESYARIKAQVKDLDAESERLLLGDESATVGLGEALLAFELRWFRLDAGPGGEAPTVAIVEAPWSGASGSSAA